MTGRTRRASTSSVESLDDGHVQWRQEASILRSVAKAEPSDSWPIFQLRDAIVLNRDGTTVENALNIVPNGPFIVRGYLHFSGDEKRFLLVRGRSPIPVEIRHCLLYSVGETNDGAIQIWVSGRAGWFEIQPCAAYQATYDTMCQATTLYYSIMDATEALNEKPARGKKSKSPSSQKDVLASMFHQYAAAVGDGSTHEDVVARCNKHAIFLISQFMQDDSVVDWKASAFYKWIKSKNGALFEKVDNAKKNPRQRTRSPSFIEPPPRATTSLSRKSESIEEIDERAFTTRTTRRSASAAQQPQTVIPIHPRQSVHPPAPPAPTPVAADSDSPFQTVLTALENCFDSSNPKGGVKVSGILNKLYFQYRFPTYKDSTPGSHKRPVEEVLHYNAAALLQAIDHDKYKNGEVYDWLVDLSKKKFAHYALSADSLPFRIVPREQRPYRTRKSDATLEPARPIARSIARSQSPSTPRIGKRPGRPVGSKSSLRPVQSNKRRSRAIFDDETDTEPVAKKLNFRSDQDGDETMGDVEGFESGDEEVDGALQVGDSLDSSSEHEAIDDEDRFVNLTILAEKMPDPMPTGYQGTWACDQLDCDFIARGGGEDELDDRISAHLREHEQLVDRMQLAVSESRGLLPISHLLEKLKQVGEGAQGPTDSQGNEVAQPIKRQLFV
ncbi:hypothetical protein ISF_08449 [Cordyceps fumosorosea ARSEF 2679]|uniref:DNA (cytosine-5)-methyltransferase 1 replication foci domain-containing protein n=1 Tax=Cordyceps fumosorosea (strain ARSEF 2679) TaxID=1081104 RepID=A0A167MD51_CORFA|nr:hypothetical protein ISF_08449 [Cordyceps fumosorosea ARSEF 2679]OAA54222.1 hypothetical protein ISF_08449 [Cordyceps fumosorosea ARSEF 2679]